MPYEVDFTGFVSNTVTLTWLERLRLQLMSEQFETVDLFSPQNLSVIARTEVHYIKPIRITDRLEGHACVAKFMNTSWTIEFSFRNSNNDDEHLHATQLGVFLDPTRLIPTRMPTQIHRHLISLKNSKPTSQGSIS